MSGLTQMVLGAGLVFALLIFVMGLVPYGWRTFVFNYVSTIAGALAAGATLFLPYLDTLIVLPWHDLFDVKVAGGIIVALTLSQIVIKVTANRHRREQEDDE